MNYKTFGILSVLTATSFTSVSAQSLDISVPTVTSVQAGVEVNQKITTEPMVRVKARGQTLINDRLRALNENKAAVDKSTLTADQKAALNTKIATNISGLNTLGLSIASGTDATSTKSLVSNIYSNFRIYAIVIPQIRLEKRIYELQNHAATLNGTVFANAQTKINEEKAKGRDVSEWQKKLDDAKVKVTADTATLGTLFTKVDTLKPADYGTTSKTVIEDVNKGLKNVVKDFESIRKSLKYLKFYTHLNASTTVNASSTR